MGVLQFMNETGASSYDAAAFFKISSPALVRTWRINFKAGGFDALIPKKKGQSSMKKGKKKAQLVEGSVDALEARIKQLEMENAYLKKLNTLVQMQEELLLKSKRK